MSFVSATSWRVLLVVCFGRRSVDEGGEGQTTSSQAGAGGRRGRRGCDGATHESGRSIHVVGGRLRGDSPRPVTYGRAWGAFAPSSPSAPLFSLEGAFISWLVHCVQKGSRAGRGASLRPPRRLVSPRIDPRRLRPRPESRRALTSHAPRVTSFLPPRAPCLSSLLARASWQVLSHCLCAATRIDLLKGLQDGGRRGARGARRSSADFIAGDAFARRGAASVAASATAVSRPSSRARRAGGYRVRAFLVVSALNG